MRDPERIDQILKAIREVRQLDPDLRLGQIVVNALRPGEPCPEIFGAEDTQLLEGLIDYRRRVLER